MELDSQRLAVQAVEFRISESTHELVSSSEKEGELKKISNDVSQDSLTAEKTTPADAAQPEEGIKGIKLVMVVTGLTFASFLMLLDTSIMSTVSSSEVSSRRLQKLKLLHRVIVLAIGFKLRLSTGYTPDHNSVPFFS